MGGTGPQDSAPVNSGYRNPYPRGAYPKYPKTLFAYPNRPYEEANNNAIDTLKNGQNTDPKDHEHIYLEREEYTAIRQHKGLRPLVNPIPNEWDWRLKLGVLPTMSVCKRKSKFGFLVRHLVLVAGNGKIRVPPRFIRRRPL